MILNLKTWLCDRFVAIIFSIFFRTRNCRLKLQPKYIRKELCVFFLFPMSINFDFFSVAIEPWIMFRFSGGSDIMKCRIICTLQSFFHWLQKKDEKGSSRPAGLPTITNVFLFSFFISVSTKNEVLFGKGVKSKGPRLSSLSSHSPSQKDVRLIIIFILCQMTSSLSVPKKNLDTDEYVTARRNVLVYDLKCYGWEFKLAIYFWSDILHFSFANTGQQQKN